METILSQTYSDWELIVSDNYSDDGSWEYMQSFKDDHRIKLMRQDRNGMYDNWNAGIERACGQYVYIATSDDTMTLDCLEKMAVELEKNPECGYCHCNLKFIDENDKWLKGKWEKEYLSQKYYGELIHKKHIRRAPLDGLLHFGFGTLYTSITQLLIRKEVFQKIGLFKADWGSVGDFEWEMKVSMLFDSVHIPEYLATWRMRSGQATPKTPSTDLYLKHLNMCESVVQFISLSDPILYKKINDNMNALEKICKFYHVAANKKELFPFWSRLSQKYIEYSAICIKRKVYKLIGMSWECKYMEYLLKKILKDRSKYLERRSECE